MPRSKGKHDVETSVLYLKIYFSRPIDPMQFLNGIQQFIVRNKKNCPLYFFLWYSDSAGPHLRLRFRKYGRGSAQTTKALVNLFKKTVPNREILRVSPARYKPEIKRYGGEEGVRLHEMISFASSKAVLSFTSLPKAVAKPSKIEFALISSEVILTALGLPPSERIAKVWHRIDGGEAPSKTPLYHEVLATLAQRLNGYVAKPHRFLKRANPEVSGILLQLHAEISALKGRARKLLESKKEASATILSSYIHLHLNRLALTRTEENILRILRRELS